MAYYLAPSLVTLRAQINAAWPHRDKTSDGWIGDASHQARPSDHNPDWSAGGVVRAIDVDKDGIDVDAVLSAATRDARTAYVIWASRIWKPGSGWSIYTGPNKHTGHIHISIRHGRTYENDTSPWALGTPTGPTAPQEEDDMFSDNDRVMLQQVRDYLGAAGGMNTHTSATVGYRLSQVAADTADIRAALTTALPALLTAPGVDPDQLAESIAAAIPDDLAQSVVDALGTRITTGGTP